MFPIQRTAGASSPSPPALSHDLPSGAPFRPPCCNGNVNSHLNEDGCGSQIFGQLFLQFCIKIYFSFSFSWLSLMVAVKKISCLAIQPPLINIARKSMGEDYRIEITAPSIMVGLELLPRWGGPAQPGAVGASQQPFPAPGPPSPHRVPEKIFMGIICAHSRPLFVCHSNFHSCHCFLQFWFL